MKRGKAEICSTITCASKRYSIILDPKINGGMFDVGEKEIRINSKLSTQDMVEVLLHEVAEAILVERNLRYSLERCNDNGDYMFILNHDEFEGFIKDLSLSINEQHGLTGGVKVESKR